VKDIFATSDYVVGNLETVCAGKKNRYTNDLYSYNSPDSLLEAIASSGIDMGTCANNHCLDRGSEGLYRTLSLLDAVGIERTGTYLPGEDFDKPFIKELLGKKIAFISATSSTNKPTARTMRIEFRWSSCSEADSVSASCPFTQGDGQTILRVG